MRMMGRAAYLEDGRGVGDDRICKSLHRSIKADALVCVQQQ